MKSETKKAPDIFIRDHRYIVKIVIGIKDKISFFHNPDQDDKGYYQELYYTDLVKKIMEQHPAEAQIVAIKEDGGLIYILKKEWIHSYWTHSVSHAVFICEGSDQVSVSQIKMEFNEFIDSFEKEAKKKKLFSSIFDW